jgi:hypothetical protein
LRGLFLGLVHAHNTRNHLFVDMDHVTLSLLLGGVCTFLMMLFSMSYSWYHTISVVLFAATKASFGYMVNLVNSVLFSYLLSLHVAFQSCNFLILLLIWYMVYLRILFASLSI